MAVNTQGINHRCENNHNCLKDNLKTQNNMNFKIILHFPSTRIILLFYALELLANETCQ